MNNRDGSMNTVLRRIAVIGGIILLIISIKWSKDGYNFDVAGDSGWTAQAIMIGYSLAIVGTVIQFVFSTNFRELNMSLIVFGLLAYGYSIYTNAEGIMLFQGKSPNPIAAWLLGFVMDGIPEPLIAWGLGESLSGDFVGNVFKSIGAFLSGQPIGGKSQQQNQQHQQNNNHKGQQGNHNQQKTKGSERRAELEQIYMRRSEDRGGNEKPEPSGEKRPLYDEGSYRPKEGRERFE